MDTNTFLCFTYVTPPARLYPFSTLQPQAHPHQLTNVYTHRNGRTKVWGIVNYFPYLQKRRPSPPPPPSSSHIRTHHIRRARRTTAAEVISSAHCICVVHLVPVLSWHISILCVVNVLVAELLPKNIACTYTPKWNVRFILSPTNFGRWLWGIPSWTRYKAQATLCVRNTIVDHPKYTTSTTLTYMTPYVCCWRTQHFWSLRRWTF